MTKRIMEIAQIVKSYEHPDIAFTTNLDGDYVTITGWYRSNDEIARISNIELVKLSKEQVKHYVDAALRGLIYKLVSVDLKHV